MDKQNQPDSYDDDALEAITLASHITGRRSFVDRVRVESSEIEGIVAPYDLPKAEWLSCGLNSCPRVHGKGYIIRTKDGRETSCGWRCGFREFGAVFEEFVTGYHDRQTEKARKKVLSDAKAQVALLLPKARNLLPDIEAHVKNTRKLADLIERDPDICHKVRNIAARRGAIEIEERIDQDMREAMGTTDRFTIKIIARVEGMAAIWGGGSILSTIKNSTIPSLVAIEGLDVHTVATADADHLSLSFSAARQQIEAAEQFIVDASKLCALTNVMALASIEKTMKRKTNRASRALQAIEKLAHDGFG